MADCEWMSPSFRVVTSLGAHPAELEVQEDGMAMSPILPAPEAFFPPQQEGTTLTASSQVLFIEE